jgi:hypothetical protein
MLDEVPHQTPRTIGQRYLVGEAGLKEGAHHIVTRDIGQFNERGVLGYAEVVEMVGLGKDKQVPSQRIFKLGKFLAEVLNPRVVQTPWKFHRPFADDFEDLIDTSKNVVIYEDSRIQSLLDLRTLRGMAKFVKDIGGVLGALPHIAEQGDEEFFWISNSHKSAPAGEPSDPPEAWVLSKLAVESELLMTRNAMKIAARRQGFRTEAVMKAFEG